MTALPSPSDIAESVDRALAEDLGTGDVTAQLIDPQAKDRAEVRCKEQAVLCGRAWFDEVFRQVEPRVVVSWHNADGDDLAPGTVVCDLQGPSRGLLSGERTALNFLQTLSGTATAARRYAAAVAGTNAKVLDTRKTLPGLRQAQKYAVRCGGAYNHRHGLYDAFLIKENHIAAAGGIAAAVQRALEDASGLMVEVEVETLDELRQALATGAHRVMLDDFTLDQLHQAVVLRDALPASNSASGAVSPGASEGSPRITGNGRKELEASGSVSLEALRAIAETGVDYISVGALTKHVRSIDYSMRFL
jgi:nicotinate-nucleotide pyrophosphorylase (carboxylating)